MKKSERAHLNGFDYSSPQPCLWFWKGGEYRRFCLWTDAKPSGQAGNRRARQRGRDRHEAIMKMNANGGEGSHGRSRSMEKGVLKTVCLRSTEGLTVTRSRYKWMALEYIWGLSIQPWCFSHPVFKKYSSSSCVSIKDVICWLCHICLL